MKNDELKIDRLEAFVYRAPLKEPRRNSFGAQLDRACILIKLVDADGVVGWGETFCNWPSVAAEHRARLAGAVMAPLIEGQTFADPPALFDYLNKKLFRMRHQSDERGPFDQTYCGIDLAAWDIWAQKAGKPLWRVLRGDDGDSAEASPSIALYASGLSPASAERLCAEAWDKGLRAAKIKAGFGDGSDIESLRAVRATYGGGMALMADANQAWSPEDAIAWAERARELDLYFLEEPIYAEQPFDVWKHVADAAGIQLAAGENIRCPDRFRDIVALGGVRVVQPDIIKWGGLTKIRDVAKVARAQGALVAPHYLGGGIGFVATTHLLAAVAPDGLLELDVSENPVRELIAAPFPAVRDGRVELPTAPGLGVAPDVEALARYRVEV